MIDHRAVATRGIGFGALAVATRGLFKVQIEVVSFEAYDAQITVEKALRLALGGVLNIDAETIHMVEMNSHGGHLIELPSAVEIDWENGSTVETVVERESEIVATISFTVQVHEDK